ncbi:MAG: methyltransferase domain-containing protein [Candidatus Thorarchaeota archaeon]|nr:methyltransferase domain-containing protein [Candidatus Thorarchaeota archaeon]
MAAKEFQTRGHFWDLLSIRLSKLLGIREGSRVLDVGTGGGSTLLAALRCVGPSGEVIGLDRNERWVEHTRAEIKRLNIAIANVEILDATDTGLPDNHFDYAISGFLGWGHCFDFSKGIFSGPDLVMRETLRVLKPGGRIGISTWLLQEDTEWMEEFVRSYSHPARRVYSKETIEGWELIENNSGMVGTLLLPERVEYTYPTVDAWWHEMVSYGWYGQLESLSKEKGISSEDIKKDAIERVEDKRTGEGVTFGRKVLFFLGSKKR